MGFVISCFNFDLILVKIKGKEEDYKVVVRPTVMYGLQMVVLTQQREEEQVAEFKRLK